MGSARGPAFCNLLRSISWVRLRKHAVGSLNRQPRFRILKGSSEAEHRGDEAHLPRLHNEPVGFFLKERFTFAYYNLSDGITLTLSQRKRAGSKFRRDHTVMPKRPKAPPPEKKPEPAPGAKAGLPSLPGLPELPKLPSLPGLPGMPGMPGMPGLPGMPGAGQT
ncbi:SRP54, partial [Symbiodinium necroappetens]